MLNYSVIQGRLTADPELKHTNSDISVTSFSVAVDRDFVKQGQDRECDFINCVAWRQSAEFVSKYFRKGSQIIVSGRLQVRKWQDNDGNNRYSTEIVADHVNFCGSKSDGQAKTSIDVSPEQPAASSTAPPAGNSDFVEIGNDDDLPFDSDEGRK